MTSRGPAIESWAPMASCPRSAIPSIALEAFSQDPEFDASQRAFYYLRVLEISTPRWTTFDAKIFGVEASGRRPASIQERAYTSPIWYTPG
jgi:hypothetical protein